MHERQSEYRGPHTAYEGRYRIKLVRKGPWVAAAIEFIDGHAVAVLDGNPTTQWTGTMGDGVDQIALFGEPVDEAEYQYLLATARWAREHSPDHPAANPRRPIKLHELPPVYTSTRRSDR